jgi:hypothetical protein
LPTPSLEIGWPLISTWLQDLRFRLLSRLLSSDNYLVAEVLEASLQDADSWTGLTVAEARAFAPSGLPKSSSEWKSWLKEVFKAAAAADMESLLSDCSAHPQLHHYKPALPLLEGRLGVNTAIHGAFVPCDNSRDIGRLLCGGQGLRGMDPVATSPVTARTACLYCLAQGQRQKETLLHFVFSCPLGADIRAQREVAACWATGPAIFELHRDIWSWRKIHTIRNALSAMLVARAEWLSGAGLSTSSRVRHRLADMWMQAS